ncbi:MAG: alpha/beta fold hydrolase, partial [Spirochaetia bacterium]|nr:alpha/beta fold hydrolase [Spirochaetia bacterium]
MNYKTSCHVTPPFYLKNPILQTVLSSMKIRNRGVTPFDLVSREVLVDAGDGVRLTGFISAHDTSRSAKEAKGLIILLHGWEGSESSAYMAASGRFFYQLGYDIFRLNLRDHGNSHHLNRGPFLGTLIDEAYGAVKRIIAYYGKGGRVFIIGFSMGANFALRIAKLAGDEIVSGVISGLPRRIIAVNPPLNPLTATQNIDKYHIIRKYFLKKWKKSLIKKQQAFPDTYNFSRYLDTDNCIDLTRHLVEEYSEYDSMEEYFSRYTRETDFFKSIKMPGAGMTAADEPVINIHEFVEIK